MGWKSSGGSLKSTRRTATPSPTTEATSRRWWRATQAATRPGVAGWLADAPFHLQLDQAVELHRVLHRELLGEGLDEAVDDHRHGLLLGDAPGLEVEELLITDLAHRRLVADLDLVLIDLDVDVGVRAGVLVHQQRVTAHRRLGALHAGIDPDQATVAGAAAALAARIAANSRGG